tara:strand:+ start:1663 stop:1947 length:285 start_codon:yes stop_codon:yes gene_type:complete
MKIKKNFTTGILTGICGVLLLFVLTGTTTRENTNNTPIYEFHDMKDTRGLIFNKVTGEYRYEEIRENPLSQQQIDVRLSNWNGSSFLGNTKYFD